MINDGQQADQQADVSGNEPRSSTENSKDAEAVEQEKVDVTSSKPSDDDHIYDEVDADITSDTLQDENRVKFADSQEKDSEPTIDDRDRSSPAVPQIEIIEGSTTLSDSDEDSDAREERRKKKLTKTSQEDISEGDESLDNLKRLFKLSLSEADRLTRENETMKERIENLSKEKTSLEKNLEDERSKMQVK